MTISQRFKDFLDVKNLTPTDIERITGYSRVSATNIRDGRTSLPKVDFIEALMRYFPDLNIRWLVLGEGEMLNKVEAAKEEADLDDARFTKILSEIEKMRQDIEELKGGG